MLIIVKSMVVVNQLFTINVTMLLLTISILLDNQLLL